MKKIIILLFVLSGLAIPTSAKVRIACEDISERILLEEARDILREELPLGMSRTCSIRNFVGIYSSIDTPLFSVTCGEFRNRSKFTIYGDNSGGVFRSKNCEGLYIK